MRIEEVPHRLAQRLRERRVEIEQATLTRIHGVGDTTESSDPEYRDGLRAAVTAALEYGIEAVERSEEDPPPMPTALLAQARLAARHGVKLETVLRRYLAGYTLLGDFLIEESEKGGRFNGATLKRLLRTQASLLDRLIAAVSEEYGREADRRRSTMERRRAERIEGLLAGELLATSSFSYDFEGSHLGLIAVGIGAGEAIRRLAKDADRQFLEVRREDTIVWAWLGGRQKIDLRKFNELAVDQLPPQVTLAVGEACQGLFGWRLTHQQARAALPVASRCSMSLVRYADVALVASLLQDELLTTSLRQIYLAPLSTERDGGKVARATLRAYFAAERNVSSAAAILGVSRNTVSNRLRALEQTLDQSIGSCAKEMEAALQVESLSKPRSPPECHFDK